MERRCASVTFYLSSTPASERDGVTFRVFSSVFGRSFISEKVFSLGLGLILSRPRVTFLSIGAGEFSIGDWDGEFFGCRLLSFGSHPFRVLKIPM